MSLCGLTKDCCGQSGQLGLESRPCVCRMTSDIIASPAGSEEGGLLRDHPLLSWAVSPAAPMMGIVGSWQGGLEVIAQLVVSP